MNETKSSSEEKTTKSTGRDSLFNLEITPEELLESFLHYWWVCVLCALVFAGVAFYRGYIRFVPRYQSSVTFTVQTQETTDKGLTSYSFSFNRSSASQLEDTFPSIIESNILQDIVCNDLGLSSFPYRLAASSVKGTNMFTITAEGGDPEMTYEVLQSVIRNYPAVAEYVIGNTRLLMLDEPEIPTEPSNRFVFSDLMLRNAAIGIVVGLVFIVVAALTKNTIRSRGEIRQVLNQHCLGMLPEVTFKKHTQHFDRSVLVTNPMIGEGYLESIRGFRNSVLNLAGKNKVIMITSTAPGEGKTTVSTNLALSLCKMNHRVLIVDGDLRNPSVAKAFSLEDYSVDQQNVTDKPRIRKIQFDETYSLSVLTFPNDKQNIWDYVRPGYLNSLFRKLRPNYDYIIVDTSPIGVTSEPCVFAQSVDAAAVVVRQDAVRAPAILNALDALLATDVKMLGCVLNGCESGYSHYGSYHYSRYGYGYGSLYGRYGYGYGYGYGESKSKSGKKSHHSKSRSKEKSK